MTIPGAKREFEIRYCFWAHAELKKEIISSFPNLRLFRSGYGWKLHHFMTSLAHSDRLALANAMVKRNPKYVVASADAWTPKERELLSSFDRFVTEPSGLELEIQSRRQSGEKIRLASKRKLRKVASKMFVESYGSQCFDIKLGEEWDPLFSMRCCGWVVSTQLTFGRHQPLLTYSHVIVSETRIAHPQNPQITGPAITLSPGVAWLVNQWEDILEEDVDAACSALIKQAGFFFEVAPRLLAGLEFDKIIP